MDLLRWFFVVMGILWVIWFFGGGPEHGRTDRPFLEPPSPLGSGETYGPRFEAPDTTRDSDSEGSTEDSEDNKTPAFSQSVSFTYGSDPEETSPDEERVVITASRRNTKPVYISNWKLESAVTGKGERLGEAVYLPYLGRVNDRQPVFLEPGEKAVIVTGRSPIGASFRLNLCTGYFEQFQDFTPRLPRECPYPRNEAYPGRMTDACFDYVDDLPRCEVQIGNPPLAVQQDSECQAWLNETVNYSGCVRLHKSEDDFYKPEWRIYLGEQNELWRDRRETIELIDSSGRTVDSLSY